MDFARDVFFLSDERRCSDGNSFNAVPCAAPSSPFRQLHLPKQEKTSKTEKRMYREKGAARKGGVAYAREVVT